MTEKTIRDARAGPKPTILWDREIRGFGLRVTPAGAKAFIVNYRADGRERRMTVGRPSELSLREARELAGETLASVRAGGDPLQERQDKRSEPTVAEAIDKLFGETFPARQELGKLKPKTVREYRKAAKAVQPTLAKLRVSAVTRSDVERAVKGLRPVARNRTLAFVSRLFSECERWGWRDRDNPARHVERSTETPRSRVLNETELAALGEALGKSEGERPVMVAAIRFIALTGVRASEALGLKWEHVDLETRRAVLADTKTGTRLLALSEAAVSILSGLPRSGQWCFGSRRGPVGYSRLRPAFHRIAEQAGLENVRLHDLRRTLASRAAASGIGVYTLKSLLGHRSDVMASRYVRDYGSALADATDSIGGAIAEAMNGGK